MLLLNQVIQKQDQILLVGESMYWRNSFFTGVSHEHRYICEIAAPYYPPDKHFLHRNIEKYPIAQLRESLKSKHDADWEDYYKVPERLKIDCLDEQTFDSVNDLNDTLERLISELQSTCACGSWEQDFARMRYLCTPVQGDKVFFREQALAPLSEGRVQISSSCKKLLARDESSLITLGMAVCSLEKADPYRSYLGTKRDDSSERQLGASYA